MIITERLTPPSVNNKYYLHTSKKGHNSCIMISKDGQCLPNCVGYAHGRFMEAAGITKCPGLPVCNAEDFITKASAAGFKTGKTPKVGAIIVWSKGKKGVDSDGAGHVAFVERLYDDGSILVSESGYGCSRRMWTDTFNKPYALSGYKFEGFIYNDKIDNTITPKAKKYTVGKTYKVIAPEGLNIRKNASKTSKRVGGVAEGTKVTCKEMSGDWMRIGKNEWICCKEGNNRYVK